MPSRAARGYRSRRDERRSCRRGRLEIIGSYERSVVGERHGARSLTARNSAERLLSARGTERIPVLWTPSTWPTHSSSSTTVWYADFKGLCKSCCTTVMQKSNTSFSSVFLSRSALSCMRKPARSFPYPRRGCCSFRDGRLCELVHSRQISVRGE